MFSISIYQKRSKTLIIFLVSFILFSSLLDQFVSCIHLYPPFVCITLKKLILEDQSVGGLNPHLTVSQEGILGSSTHAGWGSPLLFIVSAVGICIWN